MGKLTKLRKLTDFFIGKQSGSNIKELGKLQHLSGDLSIWNLQNVTDARDSFEANLKGKEHLEKLELVWDCDMDNPLVHEWVLEQLQPPVNVKILSINGYGGTRFPDWVGNSSLPLLQELYIRSCPNLKKALFTHFPSLTKLDIRACEQFEIEFFPLELFPKLESLTIGSCPNLVSFSKGIPLAPNLKEFQLWSCSNLKSLPENMHSLLPSLEKLSIFHCPKLESFPVGGLPSKLKGLAIWGCDKLIAGRAQWDLQSLHVLSRFSIADNDVMECFPEETLLPSSLTRLEIRTHKNLKSLDYKGLQHLTSLRELIIMNCMEVSMPEEGLPPSISSLTIWQCPLLEKKCEGELRKFPKYIRDPEYMTSGRKSI
jgi:Leucine-rich repeat (LRR) protein